MQLLIQSSAYQRELAIQQKGMDIPHLSKSEILAPVVPVPRLPDEMYSIAKSVEAIRNGENDGLRCLTKLRSLKTALMQDLLTGRRRVTPLLEPQPGN
jgi:type I restriction enzyme S subunit